MKPAITHSFTSAAHIPCRANTELFTAVLHSGIKIENGILGPQVTQDRALLWVMSLWQIWLPGSQETVTADLCFEKGRQLFLTWKRFHTRSLPSLLRAHSLDLVLCTGTRLYQTDGEKEFLCSILCFPSSFPVFRLIALWPTTTNQFTLQSPEDYCIWREAGRSVKARSWKYPLDLLSLAALGIKSGFT